MRRKMRVPTSYIIVAALLSSSFAWQSQAFAENNDLFPNIKDTPQIGGGSNSSDSPGPVTIDETGSSNNSGNDIPYAPLAPLSPYPIGGGGYYPSSSSSSSSTRPSGIDSQPIAGAMIRTANVPSQYSCPLFENSNYQDLNIAIASLTNSIQSVSDQCQSSQPQIENVKQTSEQIRQSILQLQAYVQDPAHGYDNVNQLQGNVSNLVMGIDRMSEVFRNVTTLSKDCGRKSMSWGRVALDFNNVINSASPFLLLLAATQPALSLAVKGAIMGTVVGSNVISTMAQVIQNNTVHMEIADQRNAVLQNTCQFTKIAKKINYIQLARSGRFQELEKQLKDGVHTYAMKIAGGSTYMDNVLNVRGNLRNNIGSIQAAVRSDKDALEEVNLSIRDAKNNALLICIQGKQLAQMAQDDNSFPNSVQQRILDAYQQNNYLKNIDLTDFQAAFGQPRLTNRDEDEKLKVKVQFLIKTYQMLLNRIVNFSEDPAGEEAATCAATTMAFVSHINKMVSETSNILVGDLSNIENDLSKNEEYKKWKAEFDKVVNEQENTNRMARVLRELTKPGTGVYNRSEFAEAAANLKRSLMGERHGLFGGESPVFAWLDYKRTQFARSKASFERTFKDISDKAFGLTKTGLGVYAKTSSQMNTQIIADLKMAQNLNIMNKKTLPLNSPQWELACLDLQKAVKDYADALDHLGTTHFMCDMIWDYLDNSVDPNIIHYCRGYANYTGKQSMRQKSYIDQATYDLSYKPSRNVLSVQDQANLVAKKMIEIGCRLPKPSDTP